MKCVSLFSEEKKKEKYFKMSPADIFEQHAERLGDITFYTRYSSYFHHHSHIFILIQTFSIQCSLLFHLVRMVSCRGSTLCVS